MTAQLLTSELSTLVQESKRKHPEIRAAAEKSSSDLKALPRTSEAQIAADLRARPAFVRPFLLSCSTRNPKLAGSAIISLQRLIVSNALCRDTLPEVLEALRECSTLALDIQLKVLQALPSLLQNYAGSLTGNLLVAAFQVCFLLYGSKIAVVSNTAAAALQQLVNSTFDKALSGKDQQSNDDAVEVPIGDGDISVQGTALDAYRLLEDICLLTDVQKPRTFQGASVAQNFGLELIESILSNHADTVMAHPEQIHVLRTHLMPLIIKVLSEKTAFATTVRTMRLLQVILRRLLFALASECEMALSLLNHMLDQDAAVLWKRVLCLEVFRGLHTEPALMKSIYAHYDEAEEKRNIVRDHLSALVRLASEKPAVIGLGQESSIPIATSDDSGEQAAMQAGMIGSIGVVVSNTESPNMIGISNRWSTIRSPLLEILDKSEAPALPATYIYSLALTCITSFSDGLARFLLPFTVPTESKAKRRHAKSVATRDDSTDELRPPEAQLQRRSSYAGRRVPVNPLSLTDHVLYSQISTSSQMVDQCWPALLAASSTYLKATMDSENYHSLIRAFQKFTQIAGLLGLATPRDAFLTTLGKHAIPSTKTLSNPSPLKNGGPESASENEISDSERDHGPVLSRPKMKRQKSVDHVRPVINARHLLCLRALLNLGIALGPILQQSWTIIIETLQQADLVISLPKSGPRKSNRSRGSDIDGFDDKNDTEDLGLEITAAETAASRMFESTSELPTEAFLDHLQCLRTLLPSDNVPDPSSPVDMLSPVPGNRKYRKLRSVSGTLMEDAAPNRETTFILDKMSLVIHSNVLRLMDSKTDESGWDLLVEGLKIITCSKKAAADVRIKAATVFNDLVCLVAVSDEPLPSHVRDAIRSRSFDTLLLGINGVQQSSRQLKTAQNCGFEIHWMALDALRLILEHCGDSLSKGWTTIFGIITSIFDISSSKTDLSRVSPDQIRTSPKLVRSSFGSLQLVCSDFLGSVPSSNLLQLLDTLSLYSAQDQDLNISLTTTTLFRNVSDFLQPENTGIDLAFLQTKRPKESKLRSLTEAEDQLTSIAALWLWLLLRLVKLTADARSEVRHSALHTLFNIFDAGLDQMTPTSLYICFKSVLIELLVVTRTKHAAAVTESQSETGAEWDETAVVLINGILNLFSQWMEALKANPNLSDMMKDLLHHLQAVEERHVLNVNKAIFAGLNKILTEIEDDSIVEAAVIDQAWSLWATANPAHHVDTSRRGIDNHDALITYIYCLGQLLRLIRDRLSLSQTKTALEQFRICVTGSKFSAYSIDIDQMTSVQKLVLDSLKTIPTGSPEAIDELMSTINGFVTLAYEQNSSEGSKWTFVALSKASITLLESFVIHHIKIHDFEASLMATKALDALAKPMLLKYKWRPQGKAPSPWRKATSTALAILDISMPVMQSESPSTTAFWDTVVRITDGIVGADCEASVKPSEIREDEDFDIAAYTRIRDLVIPLLGSSTVTDSVRRKYSEYIFRYSIIHEPHPDDLGRPGQDLLEGLRSQHFGRVHDLPPSPRSRLCYILLDDLFDLPAVHDGSPDRVRLAQAAAPYLILRAGLTLKAYIFDHPLRGRMPQPASEEKEMFYIVHKLTELKSEPRSIPPAPGFDSENKRHLHRLYPLVMKALKVAARHEEMRDALQQVLDAVVDDVAFK